MKRGWQLFISMAIALGRFYIYGDNKAIALQYLETLALAIQ